MSDEILLSESDLEKVWMNEKWEIRIEHTKAGIAWHKARAKTKPKKRRGWIAGGLAGAIIVAGVAWEVAR